MHLKEIQQKVMKIAYIYSQENNVEIDEYFSVIKLTEEVGEFAQAVLIHRKKCRPEKHCSEEISKKEIGKELADIVGMALVNAGLFGIDLEDELQEKWLRYL